MQINILDGSVTGPQAILFEDVCWGSKPAKSLVMKFTSLDTTGRPANLLNAAVENVLSVALMSGSTVDSHFTFFKRGDDDRMPVSVKSFFFSILDMDVGGPPLDSVGLTGFHSVTATQHTLLIETKASPWAREVISMMF